MPGTAVTAGNVVTAAAIKVSATTGHAGPRAVAPDHLHAGMSDVGHRKTHRPIAQSRRRRRRLLM